MIEHMLHQTVSGSEIERKSGALTLVLAMSALCICVYVDEGSLTLKAPSNMDL